MLERREEKGEELILNVVSLYHCIVISSIYSRVYIYNGMGFAMMIIAKFRSEHMNESNGNSHVLY